MMTTSPISSLALKHHHDSIIKNEFKILLLLHVHYRHCDKMYAQHDSNISNSLNECAIIERCNR